MTCSVDEKWQHINKKNQPPPKNSEHCLHRRSAPCTLQRDVRSSSQDLHILPRLGTAVPQGPEGHLEESLKVSENKVTSNLLFRLQKGRVGLAFQLGVGDYRQPAFLHLKEDK